MKPYFFYKGIKKLAIELVGNENVYLGIRPYGFHAGNMVPFVAYPIILCREIKKLGKEPKFKFHIFLNDWEQDKLDGPNTKMYPFNVRPLNTTFQYISDPLNPKRNIVDYWEPIILKNVLKIKDENQNASIELIRNSQMKHEKVMKRTIIKTIKNPKLIASILKKYTGKTILDKPLVYALAVCPQCKLVKGSTRVEKKNMIVHDCANCGVKTKTKYDQLDYWFYHKILALPRIERFNIDLCITGLDHYLEGDFSVRKALMKAFRCRVKFPKILYTQLLADNEGKILEKKKGNLVTVEANLLINMVLKSNNEDVIRLRGNQKTK